MKLQIDLSHRYACMRAHTATHLLHAELSKIFPQTKQAWSYVWPDELRFDFFSERWLSSDEIQQIAININNIIAMNEFVTVQELSYEDAIKTWAKAFFEDSYPEIVRVVSVGSQGRSVELCGGTHVTETSHIWAFFFVEQTSVAAGVKRIVALTGPKVSFHTKSLQDHLDYIAQKVSVPVKQLDAKIEKILIECDEMKDKIEQLSIGIIKNLNRKEWKISTYVCDGVFDFDKTIVELWISFSDLVNQLKSVGNNRTWIVYTQAGQYALSHSQAKNITKELNLKWWGSDSFIQWRDENIINLLNKN